MPHNQLLRLIGISTKLVSFSSRKLQQKNRHFVMDYAVNFFCLDEVFPWVLYISTHFKFRLFTMEQIKSQFLVLGNVTP